MPQYLDNQRSLTAARLLAGPLALGTLGLGLALGAAGCAQDPEPAAEVAQVGVQVAALATCAGTPGDPLGEIKSLQLKVRENVGGTMVSTLKNPAVATLDAGAAKASFPNIPAGGPREVTLLGNDASGNPKWYGRRNGVNIKKNDTTALDMTMMVLDGFTCVGAPQMPNAVFAASTSMDAGRVLITGGFGNATANGAVTTLEKPSDSAYIFDTNLGTFEKLPVTMKAARAGHSMIYLPKLNQVLIVGGTTKMTVPTDGPPQWQAADGVGLTYEVFDVASKTFIEGANYGANCKKRVFANLIALTDDYVVAMGGAPWPISSSDDYAKSDRFTSKHDAKEKTGHFEEAGNSLQLNAVRAGAAVAYMAPTANGTARYFIWGGATIDQHFCPATGSPGDCPTPSEILHGEVFVESTEPGTGALYSDFVFDAGDKSYDTKSSLFFPTLTQVKRTVTEGQPEIFTFLVVGGARYDPYAVPAVWKTPSLDDAYLLEVREPSETLHTKRRVTPKRVSGLGSGIYMHQTNLSGPAQVLISGGFTSYNAPASFTMQYFDLATQKLLGKDKLAGSGAFIKRGGHSALTLRNDCVLMFGGASQLAPGALSSTQPAVSDVYCPKFLVP